MKKRNITAIILLLGFTGWLSAQPASHKVERTTTALHVETLQTLAQKAGSKLNGSTRRPVKLTVTAASDSEKVLKAPSDYGTEKDVMVEDFSKFSTGEVGAPDMSVTLSNEGAEYPWLNMVSGYTATPGWGCHNCAPAGGTVCVGANAADYSNLNTPMLDVSGNQGICFIQFKARTLSTVTDKLWVEAAETHNMGPTWDMMGGQFVTVTESWQTFDLMFYGGGATTLFNIVPQDFDNPVQIYIDDIKVYQIEQAIATPVPSKHTHYNGTSFQANWQTVTGADSYLVNLYKVDVKQDNYGQTSTSYTPEREDLSATTNSLVIDGVESGQTYAYDVRAVKGGKASIVSPKQTVFDLVAPTLSPTTVDQDYKYTAQWSAVPSAEVYNYIASYERKADKDGVFTLTNENFDGIRDPEGNLTGWTKENPDTYVHDWMTIDQFSQAGWVGFNAQAYTDYLCVDGFQYIYNHQDAGLVSPVLDLSKDGGRFTVNVTLAGAVATVYDEQGNASEVQTKAAIALFNYDEEKEDYTQVELKYPDGVNFEWGDYSVEFTKGTKNSIIGIYAVNAPENLYIDNLKITQNYKAGDTFNSPFAYKRFTPSTEADITVPAFATGTRLFHAVQAIKTATTADEGTGRKESKWSDETYFATTTSGITGVPSLQEQPGVKVDAGSFVIANPTASTVEVFATDGTCVFTDHSGLAIVTFTPAASGTYIIKVGRTSFKVTF